MPYMCCGGTVATSGVVVPGASRSSSAARFCAVLAAKLASVLRLGLGWPVLPEVKPITSAASASISSGAPSSAGSVSGRRW